MKMWTKLTFPRMYIHFANHKPLRKEFRIILIRRVLMVIHEYLTPWEGSPGIPITNVVLKRSVHEYILAKINFKSI